MTVKDSAGAPLPEKGDKFTYPYSKQMGREIVCTVVAREPYMTVKGEKKYNIYYDEGLMEGFIQEMKFNIINHDDSVLVIDGDEGSGKSSLGLRIAYRLNPKFDVSWICYTMDEVNKALERCKGGETIMLDEAGSALYNRRALSKQNVEFTEKLQIIRALNINFIMILPHLENIDVYVRENRIKYRIFVYKRHKIKRGYYRLSIPQQKTEYSKERYFETYGCGFFKPLNAYPEMSKLVADYAEAKRNFIKLKIRNEQVEQKASTTLVRTNCQKNALMAFVLDWCEKHDADYNKVLNAIFSPRCQYEIASPTYAETSANKGRKEAKVLPMDIIKSVENHRPDYLKEEGRIVSEEDMQRMRDKLDNLDQDVTLFGTPNLASPKNETPTGDVQIRSEDGRGSITINLDAFRYINKDGIDIRTLNRTTENIPIDESVPENSVQTTLMDDKEAENAERDEKRQREEEEQ